MDVRFLWLSCGLAAGVGCYTGSAVDINHPPAADTSATDPGHDQRAPDKTTGLPCDVSQILLTGCSQCHGSFLVGAKTHLLTYEQLSAPSDDDPTETLAELSLKRMRGTDKPMPPDVPLDPADIATFEKWVKAGLPRGSCGDEAPPPDDADGGDAAPPDAGAPDATSVCTSGKVYDKTTNDDLMDPGTTCVACHESKHATALFAAGTIYPTLHEPDQCIGTSSSDLTVVLIGADGLSHTVAVNDNGNFVRYTPIPTPYRAMVFRGNDVRVMQTPVTDGDCNGCHGEWANGDSPGRVMAP
jgi:mono/diheme cytochrome c family protein